MSAPGPHAILLVIKVGPFTPEERDAVKKVEEIFGEGAWRYTMILFTQGDQTEPDIQRELGEAGPGWRLEKMVDDNGGEFYSNYTYLEVQEMLKWRQLELTEFYEKKMQEKIKDVESKYKELMEAQQEQSRMKRLFVMFHV